MIELCVVFMEDLHEDRCDIENLRTFELRVNKSFVLFFRTAAFLVFSTCLFSSWKDCVIFFWFID